MSSINNLTKLLHLLSKDYFLAYDVSNDEVYLAKRVGGFLKKIKVEGEAKKYLLYDYIGHFVLLIETNNGELEKLRDVRRIKLGINGVITVKTNSKNGKYSSPEAIISIAKVTQFQFQVALNAMCDMAIKIIELLRKNPSLSLIDIISATGYPRTIVTFLLGVMSTFNR